MMVARPAAWARVTTGSGPGDAQRRRESHLPRAEKGDNGVAFPVGGGVNVTLTDSIHVFGEGYVAPDGLNNSVKNYVEANGGVSWSPIGPVTLKVGYRHVSVDGKEGRPNHTLIDGAYVGGGVTF